MAPPDKELQWNEDGLAGMYKFLNRTWRMVNDLAGKAGEETSFQAGAKAEEAKKAHEELLRERHRVVGKVIDDFARNNFNTAIAAIMELVNATAITCARTLPRIVLPMPSLLPSTRKLPRLS